jgi:hypothetical protein
LWLLLWLSGCSASRIENGVFLSNKGYHVALPLVGWQVVTNHEADLVLEAPSRHAVMAAHASCGALQTRDLPILARHFRFGVERLTLLEQESVTVAGLSGLRSRFLGSLEGARVEIEHYVLKAGTCVHDLIYAAPPEDFSKGREEFSKFVGSFALDGAQ